MILHVNYEEIRALRSGGRSLLDGESEPASFVLAPPESRARVEALLPLLDGDISVGTLAELRAVAVAVEAIVEQLRVEMESVVLATHAADESAVAAYFDFAHGLTVARRLQEMASEMQALIEVVTGHPVDPEAVASFRFPD
ncbi:MAG TPA: hypothetical protein VLA36_01295 [Longimicrobiales bacterium]|nr:hypothetical protein [Longimicrobiales bacterium]